ncbi:MAG: hypothetical protein Q7K40_03600 [bacterium]|nr:hypothetical protein [bacterium]
MWEFYGALSGIVAFLLSMWVILTYAEKRVNKYALPLVGFFALAFSCALMLDVAVYVVDTPQRIERNHITKIVNESTPEWASATLGRIADEKKFIALTAKVDGVCSGPLDSWSAPEYSNYRYLVLAHNNHVRQYQIAMMRNSQGYQYANLNIEKALPKTIVTCRKEIV